MKNLCKRAFLILMTMLLLVSTAAAEFDAAAVLRYRTSYVYAFSQDRDKGACRMLRGDLELTVILVSADEQPWKVQDLGDVSRSVSEAIETLEEEAAAYDVALSITPVYYKTAAPADVDSENWRDNAIASIPELAGVDSWANRPVLFCVNTPGRCFARTGGDHMEYVIYYTDYDPGTVRHELLHLFGAEDFYFYEEVEAAAYRHFPRSVMLNSDTNAETDPLTAYLVGWTEEPEGAAADFMADISHLTNSEVETARDIDQQSGTGTFKLETGMYFGTLEMGVRNGLGLHQWETGAAYTSYVGDWTWNTFDGKGTLTWADGSYYTGDFADDKRTGKGTYVLPDGTTYTGDFVNGRQTGRGTLTFPDGSSYTGDFSDGKRTGKGTFTWADGSSYTGEFVKDAITGMGMMTFSNGDTYIGQFKDGAMHGMGTMYYSDGTVKNGKWVDGVFQGE